MLLNRSCAMFRFASRHLPLIDGRREQFGRHVNQGVLHQQPLGIMPGQIARLGFAFIFLDQDFASAVNGAALPVAYF